MITGEMREKEEEIKISPGTCQGSGI